MATFEFKNTLPQVHTCQIRMAKPQEKLKEGLQVAGSLVSKLNIGAWINELEASQTLADDLENLNTELQEESERKKLVASVKADCLEDMKTHLQEFLQEFADGTYIEWIQKLHPDNVDDETGEIDSRFYTAKSDHLLLWNEEMMRKEESTDRIIHPRGSSSS